MTAFQVRLDSYYGPLDLLLYLVRQREVDIVEVALAQVAAQYRDMIETIALIDMDQAGEFLVVATTLMEYKSRLLLPQEEGEIETAHEEVAQTELVRQLLEYKRFKEASSLLRQRAQRQQQKLPRAAAALNAPAVDPASQPIREVELWDLVSAFSRLMKENVVPVADTIRMDPTPIAVHMDRLERLVVESNGIRFADLLGAANTKPQLIGKFLALLELVKTKRVWVEFAAATDELWILPPRPEESIAPVTDSMPLADENIPPDVLAQRQSVESEPANMDEEEDPWFQKEFDLGPEPTAGAWEGFEPIDGGPDSQPG